jgi:hypothetical protein
VRSYRQASPSPARHRPGARSARRPHAHWGTSSVHPVDSTRGAIAFSYRASVRDTELSLCRGVRRGGHIDRQHLRDAIVAASPRISSPSDGWFGVAGEQCHAGCEVEWRKGHGRIARSGMGRHRTRRCAVGLKRRKRNDALSLGKKRCAVGSQIGKWIGHDFLRP